MAFLKLVATLGLLFSREPAPETIEQRPTVAVPFGCGLSFVVSQSHNTGSHLHNDIWAWDFRMPEGVPIVAAKGGMVRMARGDSTVGGCDPKYARHANYVVIDHGDGTEAQYLHFTSVVVEAGQKVNTGELIGYSGKTGWACGSHLHFKVARREHNGWNNPSTPAYIEGYGDPEAKTLIRAPACAPSAPSTIHADAPAKPVQTDSRTATVEAANATGAAARPVHERALHEVRNDDPAARGVAPATVSGYTTGEAAAP